MRKIPASFLHYLDLVWQFLKLNVKLNLEYKLDRFFVGIAIFLREMISVVIMFLILNRFVHIKGWNIGELFFLYSFLFLSYSLFIFFFTGIRDLSQLVYMGEMERFLIRPAGVLFQLTVSRMDLTASLGHGLVGLLLFAGSIKQVGIVWNPANTAYYLAALAGGALIQAAVFLFASCFSFWTIRTENVRNLIFFNCRRFAGYPVSFYPALIQKLLIFVIPFAFVNYFPAQYFLRKPDLAQFWPGFLLLTPFAGIVLFYLVYRFWCYSVRHYKSTGTSQY